MKYIDADRLRAEINRRIKTHKELSEKTEMSDLKLELQMVDNSLQGIISFINSLQQEQPEVDLEKEIRSMWEKCGPTDEGMGVESTYIHIEAFDIIARHFYNLGLNARKED